MRAMRVISNAIQKREYINSYASVRVPFRIVKLEQSPLLFPFLRGACIKVEKEKQNNINPTIYKKESSILFYTITYGSFFGDFEIADDEIR
jgi:hypothetical protein